MAVGAICGGDGSLGAFLSEAVLPPGRGPVEVRPPRRW